MKTRMVATVVFVCGSCLASGLGHVASAQEDPWSTTAAGHENDVGKQYYVDCPPGGPRATYPVWGTDVYSHDSSVCMAAVHSGSITTAQGGRVTITIQAGPDEYVGSDRNGVSSQSYGYYGNAFVISGVQPYATTQPQPTQPTQQPPTSGATGTTGPCAYVVHVQVFDQPSADDFDVCIEQ